MRAGKSIEHGLWKAKRYSVTVVYDRSVMNDIRLAFTRERVRGSEGTGEVVGVLFGKREDESIRILAFLPIDRDYPVTASSQIPEEYGAAFTRLLENAKNDPHSKDLEVVGWYRSVNEIGCSDLDFEIYLRYFPEPWQVTMLFEAGTERITNLGFLFRDRYGSIRADFDHPSVPLYLLAEPPQPSPISRGRIGAAVGALAAAVLLLILFSRPSNEPVSASVSSQEVTEDPLATSSPRAVSNFPAPAGLPEFPERDSNLDLGLSDRGRGESALGVPPAGDSKPDMGLSDSDSRRSTPPSRVDRDHPGPSSAQSSRRKTERQPPSNEDVGRARQARTERPVEPRVPRPPEPVQSESRQSEPTVDGRTEQPRPVASSTIVPRESLPRERGTETGKSLVAEQRQTSKPAATEPVATVVAEPPREFAALRSDLDPPAPLARSAVAPGPDRVSTLDLATSLPPIVEPVNPEPAYSGPPSGTLIWTGQLLKNGVVRIQGKAASQGYVSGELPPVPLNIKVQPAELSSEGITVYTSNPMHKNPVTEAPSAQNGWNKTIYKWDPKRANTVSVVEAPNPQNNWNQLLLRGDAKSVALVLVKWEVDQSKITVSRR